MSVQTRGGLVVEQPVLWLGMAGFSPTIRAGIEAVIGRATVRCRWRRCSFGDADGWWINGAKCSVSPGGRLKVAPGLPSEHTLRLELKEIDRPLAFGEPIAPAELEVRCVFDPASEQSIQAALEKFEKWLMPLRAQFVLGALLLQRDSDNRRGTFHVSHRGTLLAVVDFQQGVAALSPRAHPPDLWEAEWQRRPPGAAQTPHGFAGCSVTELAWTYVRRTDRDMLPGRYRTETIYYRHVPRVPMRWLRDSQLMLLRELSAEPGTLKELRERTSVPELQLAHDLACLYYAGSVTTSPETAEQFAPRDDVVNSFGLWPEGATESDPPRPRHDLTAPALLERRPRRSSDSDDSILP